jgi:ATP phosphoribosyltransferase regulatory subunit
MPESLSNIPGGMRYHFGAEARLRRAVEDAAMSVFAGWSYEEIATPAVDYLALFERGMGREHALRAFRFADADGRLLALRPDVTSSIARAAATIFAARARPLRLCYAAPVFRQRPQSHADWRRETTQLGCEFIGGAGAAADMEVLAITAEIVGRLAPRGGYRVTLNSVEVFNGVAEGLALSADDREEMRRLVDLRCSADLAAFLDARGVPAAEREAFCRLTRLPGGRERIGEARRVVTNARSAASLDELERLWLTVEALGLADSFEIDLGDVSNLDYYTGVTFKIYVAGAGSRVGGGGRYDRLTSNFGRAEPAVGFVLDLDALTDVLLRGGESPAESGAREAAAELVAGAASDDGTTDLSSLFLEARRRRAAGESVLLGAREVAG